MKTEKYNGWTNFETWKVALEFFDGMSAEDIYERRSFKSDEGYVFEVAKHLESYIEEYIEQQNYDSFTDSAMNNFFSEVNYMEIAENMCEEILK